jgi:hypothetical protein
MERNGEQATMRQGQDSQRVDSRGCCQSRRWKWASSPSTSGDVMLGTERPSSKLRTPHAQGATV